MTLGKVIIGITRDKIFGDEYKDKARKSTTDFTRTRKMPFEELIFFMLQSLRCSTQSALRRFFTGLGKPITMKQQSLSEARSKLTVWAFQELYKLTVSAMTVNCVKKWHNYRVYAIDGSKIALPSGKELLEYYGALANNNTAPTAQGRPFLCLITMTSEELSVEPRGFFNFTLPLFTEYFISSPCTGDFIGSFSFAMPSVKTRSQLKILPDYTLPPLAMSKCSEVLATAEGIAIARLTSFDAFQLQTMPIMLALGKKEELLDLIASSSCTDKEKQTLRLLVGDSDG